MNARRISPIWHPFTQHALQGEMTKIVRGEGAYLYAADGRQIIDAIASWWVVTHGHCHPAIVRAIQKQAERLNQIIFAGFTHEPAEEVAAAILKLAPRGLDYVFFSDSGSTSVEVALKMAEMIKRAPAPILAQIAAERASSPEVAKVWRDAAKVLARARP